MSRPEPLLAATALHKYFGRTLALQGADLEVGPGELVAITGPSGSGKSTLLHCLAGLVAPDGGRVLFDGTPLPPKADDRARLRRRHLGLVLQFGQLVPELTALENVAIPLLLERADRRTAAERARAWLSRLGVEDVADQRPGEMSGGQAQRVAIARALVAEPRVVLADEPTGALDTLSGEQTLDALVGAVRETGAALVLVTHDNRVAAAAEREVTVVDGQTHAWADGGLGDR
jgi:putative ABC transport system ATP-binding protein